MSSFYDHIIVDHIVVKSHKGVSRYEAIRGALRLALKEERVVELNFDKSRFVIKPAQLIEFIYNETEMKETHGNSGP